MNKCVMYNDGLNQCKALTDGAYYQYVRDGKCGNVGCPFYKEKKTQIRRGQELIDKETWRE